jgi:hypothetical protein
MKILIVTYGYFGDILFASSVARVLKKQYTHSTIDFLCGFPQVVPLLEKQYIDNVLYFEQPTPSPGDWISDEYISEYDKIIKLGGLSLCEVPTIEFQKQAGITSDFESEFVVDISVDNDLVSKYIKTDKINIAVGLDWEKRCFLFTKEEYERGIDVPNMGYGGKKRNIEWIKSELKKNEKVNLIEVGAKYSSQFDLEPKNGDLSLYQTAQLIKSCQLYIGAEGGLSNIAAGCQTIPTIITTDFIYQLYGYNGLFKKIVEPKLGPKYFFPNGNHTSINPFATDKEVLEIIKFTIEKLR